MKTCPHCGAENPRNAGACWNCYGQLDAAATVRRPSAAETRTANRRIAPRESASETRSGGGALKIIVPVLVIAILAGGGYAAWKFFTMPTPQKAVIEFSEAMNEGRYAAAAEMLTYESRNTIPIADAASDPVAQQMVRFLPKMQDLKFESVIISDSEAVLEVTATVEMQNQFASETSSSTHTETMYLLKEDGIWKIDLARQVLEQLKSLPKEALVQIRQVIAMSGGTQTAGVLRLVDQAIASK